MWKTSLGKNAALKYHVRNITNMKIKINLSNGNNRRISFTLSNSLKNASVKQAAHFRHVLHRSLFHAIVGPSHDHADK